jgi:hypothetical protein
VQHLGAVEVWLNDTPCAPRRVVRRWIQRALRTSAAERRRNAADG